MATILMIAYSCNPEGFSEELVGWNLAVRMARHHRVMLLTRPNDRDVIEKHRPADVDLDIEFFEVDKLYALKQRGLSLMNPRYLVWNHLANRRVRSLTQERTFDVVHQTTWARGWMPSAGAGAGRPLVWGPVGAVERTPSSLLRTMSLKSRAAEAARHAGFRLAALDPLYRETLATTSLALASSNETAAFLRTAGVPTEVAPSVAVDPKAIGRLATGDRGFDFLSVGRVLGWKGFHLGIRAFASLEDDSTSLGLVGDGPELMRLRSLVDKLGIEHRVSFLGRLAHGATLETIAASRVLVHPSFHDSGGFVLAEAMALGRPVVCLNIGGPPVIVGKAGVVIEVGSAHQVIRDLAKGMQKALGRDGASIGAVAAERARTHLSWEAMVERFAEAYEKAGP